MPNSYITVETGRYDQLVVAEREAKALKALMNERKYLGIDGKECALICKALGIEED